MESFGSSEQADDVADGRIRRTRLRSEGVVNRDSLHVVHSVVHRRQHRKRMAKTIMAYEHADGGSCWSNQAQTMTRWMQTKVQVDSNGRLDGRTSTSVAIKHCTRQDD